ncbi:uncharacterized protein LOC142976280 [Anticarsia gemmatalis]|uniref:uncharacterized protein LOC142976280 n=1 Tax=Anticarsia gemmatalis TaxID=129554 RepID=UPI003F773082
MLSTRFLIVVVISYLNVADGRKIKCHLEDDVCLTACGRRTFPEFVTGALKGTVPSDPIYLNVIEGNLPTVKFTLSASTLTGMKSCHPSLIRFNTTAKTFEYNVACDRLGLGGLYKGSGDVATIHLEGEGEYKVYLYDYVFLFKGEYDIYFDKDNNSHLHIVKYTLATDAKHSVVYDIKNLFDGDYLKGAAALKLINVNWEAVGKILRQPVWESFMGVYMKNIETYIRVKNLYDIFSIEV